MASISSDLAASSQRSFQKHNEHTTAVSPNETLFTRNETTRNDRHTSISLSHMWIFPCVYISFPLLSTVYTSAPWGIHDFNDHLLRGTTVSMHHALGFYSLGIRHSACGMSTCESCTFYHHLIFFPASLEGPGKLANARRTATSIILSLDIC